MAVLRGSNLIQAQTVGSRVGCVAEGKLVVLHALHLDPFSRVNDFRLGKESRLGENVLTSSFFGATT